MQLAVIVISLILAGLATYFYGAWKLSRYAARISGGLAIGVLLLPPVTYWFSFYTLKEEGKETPTSLWMIGMVTVALIVLNFWGPLTLIFSGRIAELEPPVEQISTPVEAPAPAPAAEAPAPEAAPAAENNAPVAGEDGAAAAAPAGTTGATGATNNVAAGDAAASNGAAEAAE